jgi:hypothetical protein
MSIASMLHNGQISSTSTAAREPSTKTAAVAQIPQCLPKEIGLMNKQRLPADSSSEEPAPHGPGDRGIGLLRLNSKSLAIAFVLTVLAGIFAYRVNLPLEVPELLFVLVVCYLMVHASRWVWSRRRHPGVSSKAGKELKSRQNPADEARSEESPAHEPGHRGIGLLRLSSKSLTIAFALTLLAGISAYLVNLPLQVPELLFVLVACYVLVHASRWVWARIYAARE